VAIELVAGLARSLRVVFATFAEDVGADVQGGAYSAGAVDGLNLYVYVNNNPLKYTDPTGHGINTISNDNFFQRSSLFGFALGG
jgi:hypothetical protein